MPGLLEKIYNNLSLLTRRVKPYDIPNSSKNSNKSSMQSTRKSTRLSDRKSLESKKTAATRKIQTFMKSHRHKIRALFLNTICSNSGVCITFGKEIDTIKKHFNGFVKFNYVSKIKRIGKESTNGFINEITYEHSGYKSHAILKSSMEKDADNLYFEYLVGKYINKLNLIFPCFLETYGCFVYNNEDEWNSMMRPLAKMDLKKIMHPFPENGFGTSCKDSKHIALLIQHINSAYSLHDMTNYSRFNNNELVYTLFQIYMTLSCVAEKYTHFDLHTNNILIYEPVKNKYIEYHYHTKDGEVSFKSKYITKIIDYGRCFFRDNHTKTGSSKKIMEKICESKDCEERVFDEDTRTFETYNCGNLSGYTWMNMPYNKDELESTYYISSSLRNMSHDLRALYLLQEKFNQSEQLLDQKPLMNLLNKVNYCKPSYDPDDCFGTIENKKSGLPKKINNVIDAHDALLELVKDQTLIDENDENYSYKEKLGDLHVYYDGQAMHFESSESFSQKSADSSP